MPITACYQHSRKKEIQKQNSSKVSLPDINDLQGVSFHTFYLPSDAVAVSFSSTLRDSSTSMSVCVHTHTREKTTECVMFFPSHFQIL